MDEKQQAFLLKLSDALRPLGKPDDIEEAATKIALDFMDADRCHYCTIEEENIIILRDAFRGDLPSVVGVYSLSSFALYKAVLNVGHPFVVDDVPASTILDEDLKMMCLQFQYGSFINVPVIKNGKAVGLFALVQSKPRKWTDVELQLAIETAERIWAAVERAKAEEALRKSEEKYRTLFDSIDEGLNMVEVLFDDRGKAVDYIILEINNAHEAMTGMSQTDVGKRISEVMPGIEARVFEHLEKVLLTGEPARYEHYVSSLNRWFDVYSSRVGGNGSRSVANVFNNITGRKQAEEKIKESENRFRSMADASPVLIWTTDANGLSTYYNKTFLDFIGASKDEEIFDWDKIIHPDDVQFTFQTMSTAIAKHHAYSLECRLLRADGQWRWVLVQGNPRMGADNSFLGFVGSSVDITERMEAEAKIKESEKKFEAAILAVEGIIWTNNAIGEMIGEQPGWAKLTGQRFEEYQGYKWSSAVHPEDAQPTVDAWNKAVKSKSTFEFEHRVKTAQDGWRLFSVKAVPAFDENGGIKQWVGVHTDITEQREAAKKIKESESYFRRLTDTVPAILWITEPDGICTYLNKNWYDYTGQTEEEAKGFGWLDATHPDDKEETGKSFLEANAQQKPFIASYRLKIKNGDYRWAIDRGSPKFSADGVYEGMIGTVVDVHEEKLAEEKLTYRTALLEAHNQASVDGILLVDPKGKIISYNQRFIEIWNMPQQFMDAKDDEEALSFAMTQLVNPKQFIEKVKYLYKHPTKASLDELEFKDGKIVERNGYPVIGEDGTYYAWSWTFKDITVQKNYEKTIVESEKLLEQKVNQRTEQLEEKNIELKKMNKELEAFTYISSHDLQEPLRKIQTFAGRITATEKEQLSATAKDYFRRMQDAATRMQTLIQDLLSFSRVSSSERQFEKTDVTKIVNEVKKELIDSLLEKHASVTIGQLCEVNIIPFQFRQLMHNLIGNAIKFAKPDVPAHVIIKSITGKGKKLNNKDLLPERDYCHISVSDNGIGFEEHYREKIFEVFQKLHSRQEYAGTGIGLAIVKKIVENHNGMITAESELGNGTTFNIYIPA